MPRLSGVNHLRAVRALQNAGFVIVRQGKHIFMENGDRKAIVPRNNPINANTLSGILKGAGLTIEEFKRLL